MLGVNDSLTLPLTYHEVTDAKASHPRYRYAVTANALEEHIQIVQQLKTSDFKQYGSHITFDDGHVSQMSKAVPILNRFGQRAIFFITAGWTGKRRGYMNWNQLRELRTYGHEVQSHGWSHSLLTHCSASDLERELIRSKSELQDHLGEAVSALSFPGGRWNPQVLRACEAAGYTRVFTSDPWNLASSPGAFSVLGRWMITRSMRAKDVAVLLRGKGGMVRALKMRHRLKEIGKSLISDGAYQFLWRALSRKSESLECEDEEVEFGSEARL
jgi:peptidoglycan/xylan/chitin deacetylase (PgdA/CDA1 family)